MGTDSGKWACAAILLLFLVACLTFFTGGEEKEWRIFQRCASQSECHGVTIEPADDQTHGESSGIAIRWRNQSGRTVLFGDSFTLARKILGTWSPCAMDPTFGFFSMGRHLNPNTEHKHRYPLSVDLSPLEEGEYRFVTDFSVGEKKNYEISLEFSCRLAPKGSGSLYIGES